MLNPSRRDRKHAKQQHAYTHGQQALRVDKHTAVTPIKRKNYSTDPSRAIVLEAFAVEKSVRACMCVCMSVRVAWAGGGQKGG